MLVGSTLFMAIYLCPLLRFKKLFSVMASVTQQSIPFVSALVSSGAGVEGTGEENELS